MLPPLFTVSQSGQPTCRSNSTIAPQAAMTPKTSSTFHIGGG